jgi:uncharacterized protein
VAYAARAFFENGGRKLYVLRVESEAGIAEYRAALERSHEFADIAVIAAPGYSARSDAVEIQQALIDHVEQASQHDRYRFAVLDVPPAATVAEVRAARAGINSTRAAFYYPWVKVTDAIGELRLPPSGFVCGIFARVDTQRGFWKAPANEALLGVSGLELNLSDAEQQILNPEGINCIRSFASRGILLWGARTASSDPEWKYVNVRRYLLYMESSLSQGLQWTRFEPNSEALWSDLRRTVENFLMRDWRSGALQGSTPDKAFYVHCDRGTMTQADVDNGRLVVEVGVAPVRPAEFVILRIGLWTASCVNC